MNQDLFFKKSANSFFLYLCLSVCLIYGIPLISLSPFVTAALFCIIAIFFGYKSFQLKRRLEIDFKNNVEHSPKVSKLVYAYRTIAIILLVYTTIYILFPYFT